MTTTYDPATAARLIAEAREDDGRMLSAFSRFGDSHLIMAADGDTYGTHAVKSALECLRATADQLEAAGREIERLRASLGRRPRAPDRVGRLPRDA